MMMSLPGAQAKESLRCASHHAESSVQLNQASRQPFCTERKVVDEGDSGFVLAACLCCVLCCLLLLPLRWLRCARCSAAAAAAAAVACQAKESITESSQRASTRQQQAMATKLKLAKPTNPKGSFIFLSSLFTLCFASPLMFFFFFYIFLSVAVAFSLFFLILRIPFCAAAAAVAAAAACAPEVPAPDIMGPARSHKWKPSEGHDKSARASMRELRAAAAAEASWNRQGRKGMHEEMSKSKRGI